MFKKLVDTKFLLILFLIILFLIIVLGNAWLCDDAYISLRTVDNFVHGYGLTWNIAERVQAYTHPLWIFLIIPFYAVTGEVYFTVLSISIILSLGAVAWYAFKIAQSTGTAIVGILALLLSSAFVDFSTSGLENPLTFFLLAIFLYFYFKSELDHKALFRLSLIAALGAVNRLDTIVLFAPPLVYAFWQIRSRKAFYMLILGFLPLIIWELFSLFYYGFPFPNTAYAKLNTGFARTTVWQQGFWYLLYSLEVNPLTLTVTLSGIIIGFISRRKFIAPAIAVMLYLLYIINIGGCFMSGRYLAAPLFVAVILLSQYPEIPKTLLRLWAAALLIVGLMAIDAPVYAGKSDQGEPEKIKHGIVRERDWYNPTHGLMNYDPSNDRWPEHKWIDVGRKARDGKTPYLPHVAVGMVGFYAGPQTFVLDVYAITDPLLARLPVNKNINTRVGHFGRFVPVGYDKTVVSGENNIRDEFLDPYYDKLALLTRGGLFSFERLIEIVKFNLGFYDYLVAKYSAPHLIRANLSDINHPRIKGIIGFHTETIVFYKQGLDINLESIRHAPKFEIGRQSYQGLRFDFNLKGIKIASGLIPNAPGRPSEVVTAAIAVPAEAVERGYDHIIIYPENPASQFNTISRLRLLD